MPVHGRGAGEGGRGTLVQVQVVEGGTRVLGCNPFGSCMEHGCSWTLPSGEVCSYEAQRNLWTCGDPGVDWRPGNR